MTNENLEYEENILKFWEQKNIYQKSKDRVKDGKMFSFVDGPPFPTGEAHLGHLRNWAVKDSVLRFRRLQGNDVYARDGYDVHGLPVENKVQAKLGLKTVDDLKKFGEENFVKECKKYIKEIIGDMKILRSRYGLSMDREQYQTSHPDYLSMSWKFFKKADEKGLLYKDYKAVAWCPHDETTLSDYEIKDEYKMLEDPSIYVKFKVRKEDTTTGYEESFVIWTTTPWTLQSNMAIGMNPEFNYAKVLISIDGKEEVIIVAEALVEKVIELLKKQNNLEFKSVVEVKKGIEFAGVKYEHIYLDETPSQQDFNKLDHKHVHSIIMADFVTLSEGVDIFEKLEQRGNYKHGKIEGSQETSSKETTKKGKSEGTGLVHIAPGHGFDDYEIGKKYNIPIFSPVDSKGNMTEGKYEGMYFKDVDPIAIEYLTAKGIMIHNSKKTHKYPCCWRCKTPIVYRAADQWWIRRGQVTEEIKTVNKAVNWYPEFAKTSFDNLMSGAGDWAISRQRFWGIPLPIFEDEDGNYEVFGSKEELEQRIGKKLDDIHRDDLKSLSITNEKSGKKMKAVPFIADVWFDSGCASFASHYGEGLSFEKIVKKYYPLTWVTEGEDQIRGWFSSLFNVGYITTGKAPYKNVLFQGFVMAKDGVKMSKSLGNGITGNESLETYGADASRYYLLTKTVPEAKLNFDVEEFSLVNGYFNTLRNIFKLLNPYLKEHKLSRPDLTLSGLDVEDRWILYRLNRTLRSYTRDMEEYRINTAFKSLEEFVVRDFSKVYLKVVKERLEGRDENLLVVLNEVLKKILIMLGPASPFISEDLYQECLLVTKKESIFLEDLPECDDLLVRDVEKQEIDSNFDLAQEVIQGILNAREKAKIGVRWPLGRVDIASSASLKPKLELFEKLIKKLTNVQGIKYDLGDVEVDYSIKPDFAGLKKDFDNVSDVIKCINMNKFYIVEDLKNGVKEGIYEGVKLDFEKHLIKEMQLKSDLVSSEFSLGNLVLETKQDDVLLEEGYLRELFRRVQDMRKGIGLEKSQKIQLSFEGSDEYYIELIGNWTSVISKKVGASEILAGDLGESQEFEIKGKKLVVSIKQ